MNFKQYFLEKSGTFDYSCVMAMISKEQAKPFHKFLSKIKKEDLAEDGLEKETHCTILYGLHTNNTAKIKKVLAESGIAEIHMKLKGLSKFPDSGNGVVLKVDVESKELRKLNKMLSELPLTTDFPVYRSHITLAYLKPGTEKQYLEMKDPFEGEEIITSTIKFSPAKGKKIRFELDSLITESSNFIGDCRNEELLDDIFGSVSEFARQIELKGDEFIYNRIKVV